MRPSDTCQPLQPYFHPPHPHECLRASRRLYRVDISKLSNFRIFSSVVYGLCTPVYGGRSGRSNGGIETRAEAAMSQQKITDEQWVKARRRYETEPGLGLGKVAQLLDCSKSLVARKAREGKFFLPATFRAAALA
jgi:hypothetical protein